ncbi:DHHC palmitoyltransferase-domain-containing protein [Amylostereum chailletii]|nr:DHHC palmitoyltransferase-domain-containing protein [Amylostereum chailletii]
MLCSASYKRRWYHYIPLCLTVVLLLAPHPSLLHIFIHYHFLTLNSAHLLITHVAATYSLTFLALCSLIVCAVRDPGPAPSAKDQTDVEGEMSLTDALMGPPDDDYLKPGRWCRICWGPKPERTHHCSVCGRCVLKMDHHCPWMGAKCVGYRTYPSFLHFLACVTAYALYVACICIQGLYFAFHNASPSMGEETPVHMLFLSFVGVIFSLVVGSFFSYHVYLVLTNQTTIENITPFQLLRQLPPLPPSRNNKLSNPPMEHELSFDQRRLVRTAHRHIRLYDLGWRKNISQVFAPVHGSLKKLLARIFWGGVSVGDGTVFPHNSRAEDMLARLANDIVALEDE